MSNCEICNYVVGHSSGCLRAVSRTRARVRELMAEGANFNRAANEMQELAEELEAELAECRNQHSQFHVFNKET